MRIAVIGAGISGLAAAWLLARRHHVTLFESGAYLGGHTNTVDVTLDGVTHPVDTGFLVFNDRTYPNLTAMFRHLGVESAGSDMSFSVSVDGLEWAGTDLGSVFAQRRNLVRPAFWGMLRDILRFNREATRVAVRGTGGQMPLGEFLERGGYGAAFRDWYLLPMAAAIWSCPTRSMLEYPLATFARFCHNHGLLQIENRPKWRTVKGGGREYVRRLAAGIPEVRTAAAVRAVDGDEGAVRIASDAGTEVFDAAVLACHGDQALGLLSAPTEAERRVLGRVRYQPNRAVLHTDTSLLPRRRAVWSAWNYLCGSEQDGSRSVGVSYLINKLQPLPFATPVVVTLNPPRDPDPSTVIAEFDYEHPMFDQAAIDAQAELPDIQGRRGLWFCGAWAGYGFHEDGLKSGMAVASALGCHAPWQRPVPSADSSTGTLVPVPGGLWPVPSRTG